MPQKYPAPLLKAVLVKRINRFVAEVILDNTSLNVYVPNTGRMSELALPGAEILLSPINAKYKYKILYVISKTFPVMIDSTYSNRLFHMLLKEKKVPGLENYTSIKSEPAYENHRFDFLLESDEKSIFIELKSCTLFYKQTGAFPDAVSSRASDHVKALAESGKGKLIFLVLKNSIEKFIPNYHTDFIFYETLKLYQNRIDIHAFTVDYDDNLKIQSLREIPVVIPDVKPAGVFLLVLLNSADKANSTLATLEPGYYIYCGTAPVNVFKTIASLKKKGIKTILPGTEFSGLKILSDLPVLTESVDITEVAEKLIINGGNFSFSGQINARQSGLFRFKSDPRTQTWFWDMILELRFGCRSPQP